MAPMTAGSKALAGDTAVASDIQGQVEVVMKTKALLILGLSMGMLAR